MQPNRQRPIQYESVPQPCVDARDHCISLQVDKGQKSYVSRIDLRDTTKG